MRGRKIMAIVGGALFEPSSEDGYTVGGIFVGLGLGLMVAALVRE